MGFTWVFLKVGQHDIGDLVWQGGGIWLHRIQRAAQMKLQVGIVFPITGFHKWFYNDGVWLLSQLILCL